MNFRYDLCLNRLPIAYGRVAIYRKTPKIPKRSQLNRRPRSETRIGPAPLQKLTVYVYGGEKKKEKKNSEDMNESL